MYLIKSAALHLAVTILANQTTSASKMSGAEQRSLMSSENADGTIKMLERLEAVIEPLPVPITRLTILDAKIALNSRPIQYIGCGQLLLGISKNLERELTAAMVYALDHAKAGFYVLLQPFGTHVDAAYPSSVFDIGEAAKCYAVERSTACVMHLMRALERPMQLLATDLQVPCDRAAWGPILNSMAPKIAALTNSDHRKQTYSDVAIQFRYFKDAWRDHAMHAREKYTPEEAMVIFNACKSLMQTLAPHLHE